MYELTHRRWDTFETNITINDRTGSPIDLTGATVSFSIKDDWRSASYIYNWTFNITNASLWQASITIPATTTKLWEVKKYYYDIQVLQSNWTVDTAVCSTLDVIFDITN